MSGHLEKEQRILNNLMLKYKSLCHKLNAKEDHQVTKGLFFTDMVRKIITTVTVVKVDNSSYGRLQ